MDYVKCGICERNEARRHGWTFCANCVEREGSRVTLTGIGISEIMTRIRKLEALTKAVDWNEMPIKRAQASVDGRDEKSVVSVDGFQTHPIPGHMLGASGYFVRLDDYNRIAELWNRRNEQSEKAERDEFIETELKKASKRLDELQRNYSKLSQEADQRNRDLLEAHRKLHIWRNAQRMTVNAIGHEHDGVWAKVPEGEL